MLGECGSVDLLFVEYRGSRRSAQDACFPAIDPRPECQRFVPSSFEFGVPRQEVLLRFEKGLIVQFVSARAGDEDLGRRAGTAVVPRQLVQHLSTAIGERDRLRTGKHLGVSLAQFRAAFLKIAHQHGIGRIDPDLFEKERLDALLLA